MTERPRQLTDDQLVRALQDARSHVAYPSTPDLAAPVRERLERAPAPGPSRRRVWLEPSWRLAAVGVALAIFLFAGSLTTLPSWRRAVADFLGVRGIRIELDERLPENIGRELDLGERVSLADAEDAVGFDVLVPELLGTPGEVYVGEPPEGGQVSLVYPADDDLPAANATGVGVLVTQFRGDVDATFAKKLLGAESRIVPADVAGTPAYWIEGAPHAFLYRDADGDIVEESVRLADNVLLWERDAVTFRLESALSLEEALRIAESLR